MNLHFKVNHQIITFDNTNDKVVEKSRNYLHAKFTFSEDWNNTIKTAVFVSAKGVPYNVIMLNDECSIPWEVIEHPYFTVSVFGGDLITANKVTVYVMKSGYVEGEVPGEPTPDVYTQLMNSIKAPYIGEDKHWYVWDVEKREFVDSGVVAEGTPSELAELNSKEDKANKLIIPSSTEFWWDYYLENEKYPSMSVVSNGIISLCINHISPLKEQVDNLSNEVEKLKENGVEITVDDYISQNSSNPVSSKAVYPIWYDVENLKYDIMELEPVVKQATTARAFDNYEKLIDFYDALEYPGFLNEIGGGAAIMGYYTPVGSSMYIQTLNVPDIWVKDRIISGSPEMPSEPFCADIKADARAAGMTLDEYIVYKINTEGEFSIKWLKFAPLETQKVDLTNYYDREEIDDMFADVGGGTTEEKWELIASGELTEEVSLLALDGFDCSKVTLQLAVKGSTTNTSEDKLLLKTNKNAVNGGGVNSLLTRTFRDNPNVTVGLYMTFELTNKWITGQLVSSAGAYVNYLNPYEYDSITGIYMQPEKTGIVFGIGTTYELWGVKTNPGSNQTSTLELLYEGETIEEVKTISVTTDTNGNTFELKELYAEVIMPKPSTQLNTYIYFADGTSCYTTTQVNNNTTLLVSWNRNYLHAKVDNYEYYRTFKTSVIKEVTEDIIVNQFRMAVFGDTVFPIGTKVRVWGKRV